MKIKSTIERQVIFGKKILLAGVFGLFLVSAQSYATGSAPCGPPPGGEGPCNECGPHTNAWTLVYCPSQTNSSSISPNSFCNNLGDAPTMPSIVVPIYQPGLQQTHTDYDCTNTTYDDAGISYSLDGGVQWDPPLPNKFTSTYPYGFSSQAYVNVTSSVPDLCSSPGRVNIGYVGWSVADTNEIEITYDFQQFVTMVNSAGQKVASVAKVFSCDIKPPTITSNLKLLAHDQCCNGNKVRLTRLSGKINFNATKTKCYYPGFSLPLSVSDWVSGGLYGEFTANGSITFSTRNPDQCSVSYCAALHLGIGVKAGLDATLQIPGGWASCSADASGSTSISGDTSCDNNGNGSITLSGGGLTVSVTVSAGFMGMSCDLFNWSAKCWDPVSGTFDFPCLCI